jgi:hypothetical protein
VAPFGPIVVADGPVGRRRTLRRPSDARHSHLLGIVKSGPPMFRGLFASLAGPCGGKLKAHVPVAMWTVRDGGERQQAVARTFECFVEVNSRPGEAAARCNGAKFSRAPSRATRGHDAGPEGRN